MPLQDIPRIAGLHTRTNSLTSPVGATVEAKNVVFRQPGLVEPRPGFSGMTHLPAVNSQVRWKYDGRLFAFDNGLAVAYSTGSNAWTTSIGSLSAPLETDLRSSPTAFEAKRTLFFTGAGVKRIEAYNGTLTDAGLRPDTDAFEATVVPTGTGGVTGWMTSGKQVAYRVVWGYKDSFGRLILGPPGGRILPGAASAANDFPVLIIPIPAWATSSHFVRIYRTEQADTPSEDYYLVYEAKISQAAFTVSAGNASKANAATTVNVSSTTHGLSTGDYVMVSRGEQYFSTIIAAVTVGSATAFSYDDTGQTNGSGSAQTNAAGLTYYPCVNFRDITPDSLLQDPAYFNPSDGDGALSFNSAPPACTDGTWWSNRAFYANTVAKHRFDLRMLGVGAPSGVQNGDSISLIVNGTTYTFTANTSFYPGQAYNAFYLETSYAASQNVEITAKSLVKRINRRLYGLVQAYYVSGENDAPGQIVIEEYGVGGSSFSVYASRQGSWHPFLTTSSTGALESDSATSYNRIYYSKLDQPEAVPITNYFEVGAKNKKIIRIMPLGDALYVFKQDGIFAVTGQAPFRIDEFDVTVRVTAPETVCAGDNKIFGLAEKGPFALTAAGVQYIGGPVQEKFTIKDSSTAYSTSAWACVNEPGNEFLICRRLWNEPEVYVYNYATNSWSSWVFVSAPTFGVCLPDYYNIPRLYLSDNGSHRVGVENKTATLADYHDGSTSRTIDAVGTNSLTLASVSGLAVGDVIIQSDGFGYDTANGYVTAINGSTATVVVSGTFTTGAATSYKGYECSIKLAPVFGSGPALGKHWPAAHFHFRSRQGVYAPAAQFQSDHSTAVETPPIVFSDRALQATTTELYSSVQIPSTKRVLVPSGKQRSAFLMPGLVVTQALCHWSLQGLTLEFEPASSSQNR